MNRKQVLGGALGMLAPMAMQGASFVQNPSFELNYNDSFPHYGAIELWAGGSGVNESAGPFHNGPTAIPDRARVAFAQGSTTLAQEIAGLTPGRHYWLQFWYDARNCCGGSIDIATSFADTQIDSIGNVRPAMLNQRPYHARTVPFVPAADTGVLAFKTTASGDATALFDAVTIVERDTNNVVVLNPSFEASGSIPAAGPVQALAGWEIAGVAGVDDSSAGLADNGAIPDQALAGFIQGPGALMQTIQNLVVGKTYQVTVSYNAKTGTRPHFQLKVGEAALIDEDVAPVGGAAAYRAKTVSFTASDLTAVLTLAQIKEGADVLLLDDVRVVGEQTKPLPPLQISPNAAELSPGQKLTVTITVPVELLAVKAAALTFRSPNTNVLRIVNANEEGLLTLNFDKGGANVKTLEVEAVSRGTARLEVPEAAGLAIDKDLAVGVITSFVRNPSFESSPMPAGVGYGSILAWNSGGASVGLNRAAGPFHDNGVVPDREQVAFIQNSGTLSQEIAGLVPGKKYRLEFYYNARNCCGGTMALEVRFDGASLTNLPAIAPAGDQNSYHFLALELAPSKPGGLLEFAATARGDASLLLDAVNIVQRDPGGIPIRNSSFEASGSPANVGYVQPGNLAGWTAAGGGRGINFNGVGPFTDNGRASDQDLVGFLQGGGTALSQVVSGFEPGQDYTLIFDVNGRSCCGPEPTAYRASLDDAVLVEEEIAPVGAANPFYAKYVTFKPAAAEGVLKFEHTSPAGDHTLLLDNIRIVKGKAVPAPLLAVQRSGSEVQISWPSAAAGFILQFTTALPGGWGPVQAAPAVQGDQNVITEAAGAGRKYYRLISP